MSSNYTNNASLLLYESDLVFDFIIPGVLLNGVGVLGLFGNVISIIILSRPQMRSSINCILIGLASYDSILIMTGILMFGIPALYTYTRFLFTYYYSNIFPYITPVTYPVGLIAQTGSAYLTLCVTIERYVAVCLPLRARSLCTYGRARCYVICIGIFAIVYNLPRFWEVTWETTYYSEFDRNYTQVVATELRSDPNYISIYITWMYLVVMYFFPFFCLAAFNLRIYFQVRKANSERARLSRLQRKEIGLATMLMVVVVVFFVCNVLPLVVNVLEVMKISINALTQISNLLVTLNSSVNFIIYCIFGEKFKRIFYRLFCPILKGSHQPEVVHRYPADYQSQRFSSQNNQVSLGLLHQDTGGNSERNSSELRGGGDRGDRGDSSAYHKRHFKSMDKSQEGSSSTSSSNNNNNTNHKDLMEDMGDSVLYNGHSEAPTLRNSTVSVITEERGFFSSFSSLVRSHSDSGDWKKRKKRLGKPRNHVDEFITCDKCCETGFMSSSGNGGSRAKDDSSTISLSEHVHRLIVPGTTQDITITVNIRAFPESPSIKATTTSVVNHHHHHSTPPPTPPARLSPLHYGSAHSEAAKEAVKLLASNDSGRGTLLLNGCGCDGSSICRASPPRGLEDGEEETPQSDLLLCSFKETGTDGSREMSNMAK